MDFKTFIQLAGFILAAALATAGLSAFIFATKAELARVELARPEKMERHMREPGHPVTVTRLNAHEAQIVKMDRSLDDLSKIVRINSSNVIKIGTALDVQGLREPPP